MEKRFRGWSGVLRGRLGLLAGFVLPFILFSLFLSGQSPAQVPGNIDPGTLLQLQQKLTSGSSGLSDQSISTQTSTQQPSVVLQPAVPQNYPPLLPSRLEQIMSARAGVKLQQFGYDQLGRGRPVTVPQTGAVQDDYILGPGDEIIVDLRGQENLQTRVIVDRNGQVVLPRLPPISATGRSFGEFRQDLQAAVHRAYVASDVSVSVGRVRQISVLVSGEVNNPGQQLITGLNSAVDALLLSGGIKKSGSLRNIRIQRGGREYAVDLYDVLTDRGAAANMRLADGDRILVPLLGPTVAISGLVRRPGIYEMAPHQDEMSVSTLLSLAGGQEVRGRYRFSLLRILPDGRSDMTEMAATGAQVHDSEILFVQLGADQTTNQATLSGGTGLAGAYSITSGTKLSEFLRAPGALGQSPYTLFGLIVRRDPSTLLRTLIPYTPTAVLAGAEDEQLLSDDAIKIFTLDEMQLLNFVTRSYLQKLAADEAAIRNPLGEGAVNRQANSAANGGASATIASTVLQISGDAPELDDISSVPADIQRNDILSLLDVAAPGSPLARTQALVRRQELQQGPSTAAVAGQAASIANAGGQGGAGGANESDGWPLYLPGDPLPGASDVASAGQFGELNQLGQVDQSNRAVSSAQNQLNNQDPYRAEGFSGPAQNFMDQSVNTGGYASNREARTFGELSRQLGIDPLVLINFLIDHRVNLQGAVRGPGAYFVGPSASLSDLVQAAGGTVNWADDSGVELISTAVDSQTGRSATRRQNLPLHAGTLASYVVRPRDELRFTQVFTDTGVGSVTVQGEVRHPGNYSIIRGEHLSDLLMRAGGITATAYPYGTVFLRKSAAQVERDGFDRAAKEIEDQLVVAMTRIGNDKVDPATFASMQTFVSELRNQRALGRISIVADPSILISKPQLDPLLEAGDVIYIPQRPSTVSVLGQVMQPGTFPYEPGEKLQDYIDRAGGYAETAEDSQTFIVLPDGSARKVDTSWLSFDTTVLPPGSAIVVPRDVTPLDARQLIIDVSSIFSQLAVSAASLAVLSNQ